MTPKLKLCLLPFAASALVACGPATPVFPDKLDGDNSLKVTVRAEGEGRVHVALHAGYVAKSPSCHYTPRAFGIIAQRRPVHSTAYIPVPVRQVSPVEFIGSVPLPVPNKCDWVVSHVVPDMTVAGIRARWTQMFLRCQRSRVFASVNQRRTRLFRAQGAPGVWPSRRTVFTFSRRRDTVPSTTTTREQAALPSAVLPVCPPQEHECLVIREYRRRARPRRT